MRSSTRDIALLSVVAVLACGHGGSEAGTPRTPPLLVLPSPPPARSTSPQQGGSRAPDPALARTLDRILDDLLADDPANARDLGLHEYDGKVAPIGKAAIAARVDRLSAAARELGAFHRADLSEEERLDLAILEGEVAGELFWLVDADVPHKLPQFYEPLFEVNLYLDRDYAPLEERAKALLAQEEAALAEVVHVRENLSPPLSQPVATVAARNFAGFSTYLRGDVARVMGRVGDAAQRGRFAKANEALARAADELAGWLEKEAARGDQSHVLGPQRYRKLLQVQEGLTLPLADFERMNEDDLIANRRAYEALAANVKGEPVLAAEYFRTAEHMMQSARQFIVDHHVVSLASDDEAVVRETPPYRRWNSASIDVSGPFESTKSAIYYLTLPDPSWPPQRRQGYLGTLGDLLGTTIHEVYPGHFVQERWQARAPTRVQKASSTYSFVEGWAHYGEQMMIDEGFGKEDAANELAMRHGALLRNCRFAASIGIHTKGMTVEQAERRFVEDCHQDEATAHEQAVRGTFDPGYFAYTLGKLEILALREEAKRRLGSKFSLERFHDALLSHGAPPIALIHDRVLRDLAAP